MNNALGFIGFVRKYTLQKLIEVYKTYCTKCINGFVILDKQFEWIPSKIICCCYNKDCLDFKYVVHISRNARAYFLLIIKCWIKRLCFNLSLFCKPQRHGNYFHRGAI